MGYGVPTDTETEDDVDRFADQTLIIAASRGFEGAPVCCGQPMEVRLARAHDRWGQTVFVTVWQCTICARVTSER